MRGLVPLSAFLGVDFRPNHYKKRTKYETMVIEKDLQKKRSWMSYRFKMPTGRGDDDDGDDGPITRSSADDIKDWVVDSDLSEITATTERGLNRYPLEQLLVTEEKTRLLLLVNVDDDHNLFDGLAAKVENEQQVERASISGESSSVSSVLSSNLTKNDIVHVVLNHT